jgi:hypothetical protein
MIIIIVMRDEKRMQSSFSSVKAVDIFVILIIFRPLLVISDISEVRPDHVDNGKAATSPATTISHASDEENPSGTNLSYDPLKVTRCCQIHTKQAEKKINLAMQPKLYMQERPKMLAWKTCRFAVDVHAIFFLALISDSAEGVLLSELAIFIFEGLEIVGKYNLSSLSASLSSLSSLPQNSDLPF